MVSRLRLRDSERGASTVEMAFVAILLFLLVAGVVDLGRAFNTYIAVHDAAQEGAMFASFRPTPDDEDEIYRRVIETTDSPDLNDAIIEVTCPQGDPMTGAGGGLIAVRVTFEMTLITPIVGPMLGGSINLSRQHIGNVFSGECLTDAAG